MTKVTLRLMLPISMICALLAACIGGGGGNGNTPPGPKSKVTIQFDATGRVMHAAGIVKTAPVYIDALITVTGPGMSTLTQLVSIGSGTVATATLDVPNGNQRLFRVDLRDSSNMPAYSGKATSDLDGTPVTLTISVTAGFMIGTILEGTVQDDYAYAMARDTDGYMVIAGLTYGDFSNPASTATNTAGSAFIAKYDASGQALWTAPVSFGTSSGTLAKSVAIDGSGNIVATGITGGNLFGQTALGYTDCFVSKFDAMGTHLWTKLIGGSADDLCNAVTLDTSGNIYVAGQTYGTLLTGATNSIGLQDAFVAKLDPSGTLLWARQFGSTDTDSAEAVAVDASGNASVAGFTMGNIGVYTNAGSSDLFIVRFDSQGNLQQTQQLGSTDSDQATAICIDTAGNIYIAGNTFGNLDSKVNLDATGNTSDIFVVKYNSSLVKQATWLAGTTGSDTAQGIAIDSKGNTLLAGSTNGAFPGYTNAGGYDIVLIKLDSAGVKLWASQIGTQADDEGRALAVDSLDGAVVTGSANGTFNSLATSGYDAFLISYDRTGSQY